MYSMLLLRFNDNLFRVLLFESGLMMQGKLLSPPSKKEEPGPPGIHIVVGAFAELFLASALLLAVYATIAIKILADLPKYQKKMLAL